MEKVHQEKLLTTELSFFDVNITCPSWSVCVSIIFSLHGFDLALLLSIFTSFVTFSCGWNQLNFYYSRPSEIWCSMKRRGRVRECIFYQNYDNVVLLFVQKYLQVFKTRKYLIFHLYLTFYSIYFSYIFTHQDKLWLLYTRDSWRTQYQQPIQAQLIVFATNKKK